MESRMFDQVLAESQVAGIAAMNASLPIPMTVTGGGKSYFVSEGVCGFAWVHIKEKASTRLGKYMVTRGMRRSYGGGLEYWIGEGGQSMQRKEAYAEAFANVFRKHGIIAYAQSRMD